MEPKSRASQFQWQAEDVCLAESIGGFEVSPDGSRVVFEKAVWDAEKTEAKTHLFLVDTKGESERRITRGEESCTSPRWSPDGSAIAFLCKRKPEESKQKEATVQLWMLSMEGGEARALTDLERDVQGFRWRNKDALVFWAREARTHLEAGRKKISDDSIVPDDEEREPPVRLFEVSHADRKIRRLTNNLDRIANACVSPSGRHALAIHETSLRFKYDHRIRPEVRLWNLETGECRPAAPKRFACAGTEWMLDGERFLLVEMHAASQDYLCAGVLRLWLGRIGSEDLDLLPVGGARGLLETEPQPTLDGFVGVGANGVFSRPFRARVVGTAANSSEIGGAHVGRIFGLKLSVDSRTAVYLSSNFDEPPQLYAAELYENELIDERKLTSLNAGYAKKPIARGEVVTWKGALDETVEGLLTYPHGYEEGTRCPLVLAIHGGPHGHDRAGWQQNIYEPVQMLAERGAFVLQANYHGSSGYGLAWSDSIRDGKYYSLPLQDLSKGVEALIERGLVDPGRLATMGWSNGAIYSIALAAQDPRFAVASCGAGGAEWVADWGACEFGLSFSNYYLGKSPLEDPERYLEHAPLYRLQNVRAATIFFHGTQDSAVPPHHSWLQYRALQEHANAPTKLVLFPGEPHGLKLFPHRLRKVREEIAFFDEHFFGLAKDEPWRESLEPASELARLVSLREAARDRGRFGFVVGGVLVPEVVEFEGLTVGRFEVTQAQFAAFQHSAPITDPNFPAHGISYEQAVAYCSWLSAKTGERYRLPNAEDAAKLYKETMAGSNTLDRWAGYSVGPEDAVKLAELVEAFGAESLLLPVGSTRGCGKAAVFDLGGNVAEWCSTPDGGVALGGSADRPSDPKSPSQPRPEFIGFRVVRA